MKIGFDLHGVIKPYKHQINEKTEQFMELNRILIANHNSMGDEVIIVSGPPEEQIFRELIELEYIMGIHYGRIISVVDFLKSEGVNMWKDDKNTWWASDEDWWSSKAKICKKHNIYIMVDDKEEYAKYFNKDDTIFILAKWWD